MERQIILDTETTGLEHQSGHRIIEVGALEMINRRLTGRKFHYYVNPEREVDKGATEISGLTLEFLKDKPKFNEIVDELIEFIYDAELIIHNAPFDMGFMNAELKRLSHRCVPLEQHLKVFDTLVLARKLHPGQKNNLDALCKRYGVDNTHRNYHGALLDAEILAKVYLQMTAGQATLSMEEDRVIEQKSKAPIRVSKIQRSKDQVLAVVKASEEDLKLHHKIMEDLAEA